MKAVIYIPKSFPKELWLALYDATGTQILHFAFTDVDEAYAWLGEYNSRGDNMIPGGRGWEASVEYALNAALESVV